MQGTSDARRASCTNIWLNRNPYQSFPFFFFLISQCNRRGRSTKRLGHPSPVYVKHFGWIDTNDDVLTTLFRYAYVTKLLVYLAGNCHILLLFSTAERRHSSALLLVLLLFQANNQLTCSMYKMPVRYSVFGVCHTFKQHFYTQPHDYWFELTTSYMDVYICFKTKLWWTNMRNIVYRIYAAHFDEWLEVLNCFYIFGNICCCWTHRNVGNYIALRLLTTCNTRTNQCFRYMNEWNEWIWINISIDSTT